MQEPTRTVTPSLTSRKCLKVWRGPVYSLALTSSWVSGRWKWMRHLSSILPLWWGCWVSLSASACHSDCANTPTTFQRLMQNCLGELNLTYCLIYLDDVITFSTDEDDHLCHMRVIFDRFRVEHLKLKPSKCSLFCDEIIFLAHHVMKDGVQPSEEHVKAITNFPEPDSYTSI